MPRLLAPFACSAATADAPGATRVENLAQTVPLRGGHLVEPSFLRCVGLVKQAIVRESKRPTNTSGGYVP